MLRKTELTINTVRRISAELRPSVLDHLGLSAALQWQIDEFRSRTGIQCLCRGLRRDLRLDAGQSTAVFRIFQEVLTNILRHAFASAMTVDLRLQSGWLTLRVADNGKGLDPKSLSDPLSLGLLGMRERALLLGGEVRFSARRGGGTVVTLRIPTARSDRGPEAPVVPGAQGSVPRTRRPRILLADDHEIFRNGMKSVLAHTWPEAAFGEVGNASQVLHAVLAGEWDIVVLDLSLPDKSGMVVLKALRRRRPRVPVLILTMHNEPAYLRAARRSGASGYIDKSSPPAQITAAVAAILSGRTFFPEELLVR